MAEEIDPVRTLTAAKNKLVEERRALVVAIALGHRRRRTDDPYTNDMRDAFISIQNMIEAIDRAIAHERLIGGGQPESLLVPILESVSSPDCSLQLDDSPVFAGAASHQPERANAKTSVDQQQ